MTKLISLDRYVPATGEPAIAKVRELERVISTAPQSELQTDHVLHGGIYTRTVKLPAKAVVSGALIKVATTLILSGDCTVYLGNESVRVVGYCVMAASGGRKQAFLAHKDTYLTMSFPTDAQTIEQAETEFTDEAHLLMSRCDLGINTMTITGEQKCPA